jgi:hypothetical protein
VKTAVLIVETADDFWQVGMHKLYDLFQVALTTAQISLSNRCFALPASTAPHLSQKGRTNEVPPHASIVKDYSAGWPISILIRKTAKP